jgi:hypothetical protein
VISRSGEAAQGDRCIDVWFEIVCSDVAEHRRRVETRNSDIPGLKLPNWEAVTGREYHWWRQDRFRIDTAHKSVAECVTTALAALKD